MRYTLLIAIFASASSLCAAIALLEKSKALIPSVIDLPKK
jgi:hypothetical protein